jgi:hypothetical protein
MDIEVTYENGRYYADRNCPICGDKITHSTNGNQKHAKYYLIRNIKTATKKNIKCHKCTVISQTGNGNPFAGKKHSETTLSKISKSRQGKGVGSNNAMNNPENRKKVSIGLKKSWLDENSDNRRKKLSGYMSNKHKLGKLKYSPTSKTQNEILSLLKKDYNDIKLNFNIEGKLFDFYIPNKNILIEFNGDYWHCNPKLYKSDYINKKKGVTAKELWDYDKQKTILGESKGFIVITIWEYDYKENGIDFILSEIKKY